MKNRKSKLLGGVTALVAAVMVFSTAEATSLRHAAHKSVAPAARVSHSVKAGLPTVRFNNLVGEAKWTHTFDPAMVTDATSYGILQMIYANLVKLTPAGKPTPDAATWTVSKNRKVYTFTIKSGAKFSNGDPVTAQDAAFSIERSLSKAQGSPVAVTYLGHIKGASDYNAGKTGKLAGLKVLNSHQLRITLDKPVAFFLAALTYPTADILDPKMVRGKKPQTYLTEDCSANVGAGPFELVCRNNKANLSSFYPSGSTPTINLQPNPNYFGPHPKFKVTMPVISTFDVNWRQYLAGGIDETVVPTADIKKASKMKGFVKAPTSQVNYLTPDATSAPFNNVHCRLAVAYAIDQKTIDSKVLHGQLVPLYDIVPKGMPGWYNGNNNPHFDPTRAKSELAQCPGGIKGVDMPYPAGSSDTDNQVAALQAMWTSVGIGITPTKIPLNNWYNLVSQPLSKTNTKLTLNGWIMDYDDPQDYVTLLNHTGSNYDISGFSDKTFDSLADKADVTANTKKRMQLYIKAQHIAVGGGYWINLGQSIGYAVVNPKIHGLVPTLQGLYPKGSNWANVTVS